MKYTKEQLEAMKQAAPDMLEALEECITSMIASGYLLGHVAVRACHAAIAKAKGEKE